MFGQAQNDGMASDTPNTIPEMRWNERITIARTRVGINKSEFARRAGVSTATTADWETGNIKMIDGRNLVKIAAILKVSPEWIMNGSGQPGEDEEAIREFAAVYRNATPEGRDYLRSTIQAVGKKQEQDAQEKNSAA